MKSIGVPVVHITGKIFCENAFLYWVYSGYSTTPATLAFHSIVHLSLAL